MKKRLAFQKGGLEATRDRNAAAPHRIVKTPVSFGTVTIAIHGSQCYLSHRYYGISEYFITGS